MRILKMILNKIEKTDEVEFINRRMNRITILIKKTAENGAQHSPQRHSVTVN